MNNNGSVHANSNAAKGKIFERAAGPLLEKKFGVQLESCVAIPIGNPKRLHKFDLASADQKIVIECKALKWTSGGLVPSAKLDNVNTAVFYLSFLPATTIRYVVMEKQLRVGKQESLAEYYHRTYNHLLDGVKVLELDIFSGSVKELGL